jgi:hypothetical protein
MKKLSILLVVTAAIMAFAVDENVEIHNGFGTGQAYIKMDESEKRTYAMGAINGMLLAPLFGAPKDRTKWFESYIENMTDEQVAAILTKFLRDNPGRWHEGLHALMYSAIRDAYRKSRTPSEK